MMTDAELADFNMKYPFRIQCLYHEGYWQTLASFKTRADAEKDFHRYKVKEYDPARYRIIDIRKQSEGAHE